MAIQTTLLAIVLLIIVPIYVIYKPPKIVMRFFQAQHPEVLYMLKTSQKIVALTIDDAPSAYTEPILEILQQNNASATFFVIGDQVGGREVMLENILKAGSELGNHAMHDEPSITLASDVLKDQISLVDNIIETAHSSAGIIRPSHWFRAGSGIFSQRLLDIAAAAGYRTIMGDVYPHDPFISFWRVNAWHILSGVRPGSVILCHDRRSWTVPMLREVVPQLKARGYEVVSVTKFLELAKKAE